MHIVRDTCSTEIKETPATPATLATTGDSQLSTMLLHHSSAEDELAAEREAIQWLESLSDEEFQAQLKGWEFP